MLCSDPLLLEEEAGDSGGFDRQDIQELGGSTFARFRAGTRSR